jgi:NRPS condensation-like uncharacterized protein
LTSGRLDQPQVARLAQVAHDHGATINDLLVTALALSVREHRSDGGKRPVTVAVPINLRAESPFDASDCLGNFVGGVHIATRLNPRHDFWKQVRVVRSLLQPRLTSSAARWSMLQLHATLPPTLIDAMLYAAYDRCDDKAARRLARTMCQNIPLSVALSNLGRASVTDHLGALHVHDLVFFSPKSSQSHIVAGAVTMDAIMQIGFSYDQLLIPPEKMESIKNRMLELLLAA